MSGARAATQHHARRISPAEVLLDHKELRTDSMDYADVNGEIVVLSGLSAVRDQRAALEAGATAYLQNGIALDALSERLGGSAPAS